MQYWTLMMLNLTKFAELSELEPKLQGEGGEQNVNKPKWLVPEMVRAQNDIGIEASSPKHPDRIAVT